MSAAKSDSLQRLVGALVDPRTGTHFNPALMRYECIAIVDDKPRLLGWYSAALPKPIQQLHERKVWAEFIRPNAEPEPRRACEP